jgi:GTP cyclohydrolase I
VQERLTSQIADRLDAELAPQGVAVVLEAEHLCMTMRGVRAAGSVTRTSVMRGVFRDKPEARAEALDLFR